MDELVVDIERTLAMEPELLRRPALRVARLLAEYDADTKHKIPKLWERLVLHLPLPGQSGGESYGICWSSGICPPDLVPGVTEGLMTYLVPVEV